MRAQLVGNPCSHQVEGNAGLQSELLARLPRLRDLDGPLEEEGEEDVGVKGMGVGGRPLQLSG